LRADALQHLLRRQASVCGLSHGKRPGHASKVSAIARQTLCGVRFELFIQSGKPNCNTGFASSIAITAIGNHRNRCNRRTHAAIVAPKLRSRGVGAPSGRTNR
jgi:hypothetical protein